MSANQKKQCIVCGDEMTGRPDKRFCSDNCRSTHHNRQNSDTTNFIRNINNTLRKNRRILAALNPSGKANVHRDKLVEEGFNFRYFTNEYITKKEVVYRFVYDQGYTERENDYFTLVVRQEYVQ
jgi:predicted nucleic acid-binding Zn ribbon protein